MIDLSWLTPIAATVTPLILAAGYAAGLKGLRDHKVDTTLYEAVGRAGGVAYTYLLNSGRPVTDTAAMKAAASAGGDYLVQQVGQTLLTKGVANPAVLAGAELGKLLAADPTISVGVAGSAMALPGVTITDRPALTP